MVQVDIFLTFYVSRLERTRGEMDEGLPHNISFVIPRARAPKLSVVSTKDWIFK